MLASVLNISLAKLAHKRLTRTEGDDGTRLPLDLNSDPIVHFLFSGAGGSSGPGLGTAAAPVAGHRLCAAGPGARGPL